MTYQLNFCFFEKPPRHSVIFYIFFFPPWIWWIQFAMGHPVDGCLVVFGWVDGAIHHPFTLVRSKIPFPKSFIENSLPKKGRAFIFATISTRYHSRFIVQVGHETMYAGLKNHIFYLELWFTIAAYVVSCPTRTKNLYGTGSQDVNRSYWKANAFEFWIDP